MNDAQIEIAQAAAVLIAEEGVSYAEAKRLALKRLGLSARTPLPSNEELELALRDHLRLYCSETQPRELTRLREVALDWMNRLTDYRPLISGAVWHGTATRHSPIHLHLYADDGKTVEIDFLNRGWNFEVHADTGPRNQEREVLSLLHRDADDAQDTVVLCHVHMPEDLHGALKPDRLGRRPMGNASDLTKIMNDEAILSSKNEKY